MSSWTEVAISEKKSHFLLPSSAFDPSPTLWASRCFCGPSGAPCKDCAASAVVTVIIRGSCSLPSVLSRIQARAAQLQALDLNGLRPPLGVVGAAALKDVLLLLRGLLALALDNHQLQSSGIEVLSPELVKLTLLQALSLAENEVKAVGAAHLAAVLSSLTGLQRLDLASNSISDAGSAALEGVLSSLTGLHALDLKGNSILAAGAVTLACVLTCLVELEYYNIDVLPSAAVRCSTWLERGLPVPPAEVVSCGWKAVMHYLSSADKVPVHKIRMLVIGDSEMGKTSLVRALKSADDRAQVISSSDRTVGIDICPLTLSGAGPSVDALIYDLAGQDVYTLSHTMHFTGRCLYLLLWKPGASLESALSSVSRWLETLSVYVPDAIVLLVGSHCLSRPTDEFQRLSARVQERVHAKVAELNELSQLEAIQLHELYKCALGNAKAAVDAYKTAWSVNDDLKRAEEAFQTWLKNVPFQNQLPPEEKGLSEWQLRGLGRTNLPRSLRVLASCVHDANCRAQVLRDRICVLLALRDGAEPHNSYPPAKIILHCVCVDSVAGIGIADLRRWLHEACMRLKFMGELLPKAWIDVAQALPSLSSGVLTMDQATCQVRGALDAASITFGCSDEEVARILRFWSRVGEIFV